VQQEGFNLSAECERRWGAMKGLLLGLLILAYVGPNIVTVTACTIFTLSKGETVLFGNNEDYYNRSDIIYYVPAEDGRYGAVYLGQRYPDRYNPQGGMNEAGLAFDANALPVMSLTPHPELPSPRTWIAVMMMEECATVEEAIEMAKSYNWGSKIRYQLHLADATGDAVVISAGRDGDLAFTRLSGEGFLVSTNFNLASPENGWHPCNRYDTATAMLSDLRDKEDLSLEDFNAVLAAVVQKSETINTVYSNIFDPKNLVVHLYYFHQFEEVVTIDLREELEKGFHYSVIGQLFSPETRERARAEMKSYIEGQREPSLALMGDVLLAIGFSFSAVLATMVFSRALPGDHAEKSGMTGDSGSFDWVKFLRPDAVKVVVTLFLPAVVALLVTWRPESVLDFFWYLLTPMMPYYDGTKITRIFNWYVLLWVPFYLAACTFAYLVRRRK